MTLSGLKDGDNATNGKGYIDIVDTMASDAGINSLEKNSKELFRRVAFRNHGFLLRPSGYYLISQEDAVGIVNEVYSSVRDWRQVARGLQITDTEQRRFSDRFDWGLNQYSLTTFRRRSG